MSEEGAAETVFYDAHVHEAATGNDRVVVIIVGGVEGVVFLRLLDTKHVEAAWAGLKEVGKVFAGS